VASGHRVDFEEDGAVEGDEAEVENPRLNAT